MGETGERRVAGIDENGLGPRLGPLVVTGALFAIRGDYGPEAFARAFADPGVRGAAKVRDSKAVMSSRAMAAGETTVLALAALLGGGIPETDLRFLERVCGPDLERLRGECPAPAAPLCFGAEEPLPLFGGSLDRARELAGALREALDAEGVRLEALECEVLCPRRFNRAFRETPALTKADLDLALFERRVASLSRRAGPGALFLCGKVMNLASYAPRLSLLRSHPLLARSEAREESRYSLQDLGELRFLLDGDALHPPISAASMAGKYVRELFVRRLNLFFSPRIPGHRPASGYGDPATDALVRAAPPLLAREGIPGDCFLRER